MQRIQLVLGLPEWMKVPEQRVIDETEAMEGYESYLSLFQDGEMQFLTRYRGDPEAWAEALDEMDRVLEYEIIPVTDDEFYSFSRTRREGTEEALKSLLDDAGAFLDHPIEYPVDDGKVRLAVVGEQDALREVIDGFHDDIAVTIERIKEVGTDGESRRGPELTARQREAITAAHELGYYAVPREGSVADVAERLDCTPGTASNHLRKAESEIIGWMVDY